MAAERGKCAKHNLPWPSDQNYEAEVEARRNEEAARRNGERRAALAA